MIWIEKSLALVAGFCLLTSAAQAISDDAASQERNYRVIIDRNVFGLKPPPPPPTNAPVVVAPPKDEILLTGITTIGTPRAYFATKAPQGKDPEKYSLGVDERKNALEVLAIDKAGVRVRNAGLETVMTFASNGVKPPASPTPPPGAPGNPQGNPIITAPGNLGMQMPPPLTTAGAPGMSPSVSPVSSGRVRAIPSRNMRMPSAMPQVGMNPAIDVNQPAARPNPDAAVQDALLLELQKRANPNITFPPTPGLPQ